MAHDESEAISGDIASPYKKGAIGEAIKNYEKAVGLGLKDSEQVISDLIIKLADLLEALLFTYEEQKMGNQTLEAVQDDIRDKFCTVWKRVDILNTNYEVETVLKNFIEGMSHCLHPCMEVI